MNPRIVLGAIILVVAAACKKDDAAGSPDSSVAAARSDTVPLAPPTPSGGAAAVRGALGEAASKTPARPSTPPAGTKAPATSGAASSGTASAELTSATRVFTVQVASFLNAATARSLRARLERAGIPAWTATSTVGGEEFTRVRVGAATNAADARAVAAKIRATYHWPVWVTSVENRGALPNDVLNATRAYAGAP